MDGQRTDACSPTLDNGAGEWSWVSGGKKGKGKKKKMKNARTLSLQTFFSEHASPCSSLAESSPPLHLTAEGDCWSGDGHPTEDEILARESLLTYFSDLIRRSGPLQIDGPQLRSHFEDRLADGDFILNGRNTLTLTQMPKFLASSPDLVIVDNIVCDKNQMAKAKAIALTKVLEQFNALSTNFKPTACSQGPLGPPTGPSKANVWQKGPPSSISSTSVDPLLQLPKVESLFNGSFVTPLPDLTNPPPPLGASSQASSHEILNRTLTTYNTDLLIQLKDQEMLVHSLKHKLKMAEQQLVEAKGELARASLNSGEENCVLIIGLKKELESERLNSRNLKLQLEMERQMSETKRDFTGINNSTKINSADDNSSSSLIISLTKELEGERLNSRNLKRQLELERQVGKNIQDRHTTLMTKLQTLTGGGPAVAGAATGGGATINSATSTPPPSSSPSPATSAVYSSFGDSFGLRGLLANATSPQNTFNSGGSRSSEYGITAQQLFTNLPSASASTRTSLDHDQISKQFKHLGS